MTDSTEPSDVVGPAVVVVVAVEMPLLDSFAAALAAFGFGQSTAGDRLSDDRAGPSLDGPGCAAFALADLLAVTRSPLPALGVALPAISGVADARPFDVPLAAGAPPPACVGCAVAGLAVGLSPVRCRSVPEEVGDREDSFAATALLVGSFSSRTHASPAQSGASSVNVSAVFVSAIASSCGAPAMTC